LLDEADKCDRLAILDRGAIVADGTPGELKSRIGGDMIALTSNDTDGLAAKLPQAIGVTPQVIDGRVRFEHTDGPRLVARLMEALPRQIVSVTVSKPSLEDVFIHLTGHRFQQQTPDEDQR
jgi:ABC-2 type transport system ATP-binding protein